MDTSYLYIISLFIIIIILYVIYYYVANRKTNVSMYNIPLITDEEIFNENYLNILHVQTLVTTRDTLFVPKLGYGLSFVWEMYIPSVNSSDNWQTSYNRLKPIISMSDSPIISYHPKKNYLSIVVKYRNNPFYAQFAEVRFDNIKPRKWSKYIVIIENRNIRLYIDDILVSTKQLPSLPVIYDIKSDIVLGQLNNNFQGKIRNLSLYPYPLSYNDLSLV